VVAGGGCVVAVFYASYPAQKVYDFLWWLWWLIWKPLSMLFVSCPRFAPQTNQEINLPRNGFKFSHHSHHRFTQTIGTK
jgi:hypothetical protein